jgi:hypothetical protein
MTARPLGVPRTRGSEVFPDRSREGDLPAVAARRKTLPSTWRIAALLASHRRVGAVDNRAAALLAP